MTNKERLEANNAKIEQILQNLDGKIVALIDKSITVELPEEFAVALAIYNFKVDDNTILFSADTSNTAIGVWSYKIKEKTRIGIDQNHSVESWYGDFSNLKKHMENRE